MHPSAVPTDSLVAKMGQHITNFLIFEAHPLRDRPQDLQVGLVKPTQILEKSAVTGKVDFVIKLLALRITSNAGGFPHQAARRIPHVSVGILVRLNKTLVLMSLDNTGKALIVNLHCGVLWVPGLTSTPLQVHRLTRPVTAILLIMGSLFADFKWLRDGP